MCFGICHVKNWMSLTVYDVLVYYRILPKVNVICCPSVSTDIFKTCFFTGLFSFYSYLWCFPPVSYFYESLLRVCFLSYFETTALKPYCFPFYKCYVYYSYQNKLNNFPLPLCSDFVSPPFLIYKS